MSFLLFLILTILAGAIGGALAGVKLAGKHIGNELAALMGSFYGMLPVAPAALALAIWFAVAHR